MVLKLKAYIDSIFCPGMNHGKNSMPEYKTLNFIIILLQICRNMIPVTRLLLCCQPLLCFAVRIDPSKVYFLKFILEGYDNIFIVTTLNPGNGTLLVRAASGYREELHNILESVREQTGLVCMEEV